MGREKRIFNGSFLDQMVYEARQRVNEKLKVEYAIEQSELRQRIEMLEKTLDFIELIGIVQTKDRMYDAIDEHVRQEQANFAKYRTRFAIYRLLNRP